MKTLACLFTAALMSLAGLVAVPASAAPYPHSVATNCQAVTKSPIRAGRRPVVRFRWFTAGNATPSGKVRVRVVNRKTGKAVHTSHRFYRGGTAKWRLGRLSKGNYRISFVARPGSNSVFTTCRAGVRLRVKR